MGAYKSAKWTVAAHRHERRDERTSAATQQVSPLVGAGTPAARGGPTPSGQDHASR
ncbi:hypothetical protein [Nocardia altamirensis]|uniref:hypothetical protein n=1 Tax=Nocardia altamirensis TaxID=472158 RepID=UPI00143565DF|nr:hypothetical protein [Nocardia altamirensis]